MAGDHGHRGAEASAAPPPGSLTALLREIADGSPAGEGWTRGLGPGDRVGRFEIVSEIGRGGFGVVYEARDLELGRRVAFKAVRTGDRSGLREERLAREAEAAARLSHPNIVTLYDVGRSEHGPYLVLELLRGETLEQRLARGPVSVREAVRIGVEVAKGLAHAHGEGVVHRDLKPGNVFLCEDGQVKLLDFGLAHAFGQRRQQGGTAAYMAPEQWRGAPEDERTDVFALGVLLHRLLAGELPFGEIEAEKGPPSFRSAPALHVPDAPALGDLVSRMLAKDPVERPRDGGEVLQALLVLQRELERAPSSGTVAVRARRRHSLRIVALVASGVVVGALAALVALRPGSRAVPEPEPGGRITVAVADFANETGEPELSGLSGMLITSLEQSRRLSVLTRARMLDILRQLDKVGAGAVDEVLGREVARSAGARALVLATIRRFDQLYAIELKVLDPSTSEYLFTLKQEGKGKASIPGMIDRLSEQARAELRESPAEVAGSRVKVADATTASFDAWQHYARGEQLMDATRYPEAIEEYRRAAAADPTFALAHYQIAYLGKFTGIEAPVRNAEMAAALKYVDRVPEKQRLFIQAWKAVLDGRGADAQALYARALERFPQDKDALYLAGDRFFHEEPPRYAEALTFFERAVALDPLWEPGLMHLTDCLYGLDRKDELLAKSRWWVEKAPGGSAYRALAHALIATGRPGEAVEAARKALSADGSQFSRGSLAEALLVDERAEEAEDLLRKSTPSEEPHHAKALVNLAAVLAYQGRLKEALRTADALPGDDPTRRAQRQGLRVQLMVGAGLRDPARADVQGLARAFEQASLPWKDKALALAWVGDLEGAAAAEKALAPGVARSQVEALRAWREGRRGEALALLRDLAPRPEGRQTSLWLFAEVASEDGRDAEVVRAVDELGHLHGGEDPLRAAASGRALYLLARSHERLGERAQARAEVDRLLARWKRADPDLPSLAEAKALRKRLGAS